MDDIRITTRADTEYAEKMAWLRAEYPETYYAGMPELSISPCPCKCGQEGRPCWAYLDEVEKQQQEENVYF
jgi:hypothetical protein